MSLTEYRNRTMKNYALTLEYKHLQNRAPGGIYVLPYGSLRLWTGVIFIRQGVYRDGIFKFKIIIPANYPADNVCPSVIFDTPVFHPLVNPEVSFIIPDAHLKKKDSPTIHQTDRRIRSYETISIMERGTRFLDIAPHLREKDILFKIIRYRGRREQRGS